tara:strand:+ start:16650 stop:17429 length:780 start_codon:yes stop_codon:yes gene_type:complete
MNTTHKTEKQATEKQDIVRDIFDASPLLIALIISAAIIIFGSDHGDTTPAEEFAESLDIYEQSPTDHNLKSLLASYSEEYDEKMSRRDNSSIFVRIDEHRQAQKQWYSIISRVMPVLAKNHDYNAMQSFIDKGFTLDKRSIAIISEEYSGNNSEFYRSIGSYLYARGKPRSAYMAYAKSALIDTSKVSYVRGLLEQMGCTNTYNIWGELSSGTVGFQGQNYPSVPATLTIKELAQARQALREGNIPEINEPCALHFVDR